MPIVGFHLHIPIPPLLVRLLSIFGSDRALDSEPLAHHSASQSRATSLPRYSSQILTLSALHPKIGFRTRASALELLPFVLETQTIIALPPDCVEPVIEAMETPKGAIPSVR
jgi:hypothetical protein